MQSNSETHHEDYEPKYIFRNAEDEDWLAGPVSGGQDGWLWNGNPSSDLPEAEWEVFDGLSWSDDSKLKITKGELTPCQGVQIFGSGIVTEQHRHRFGIYNLTPKMWNGHPVYKNNEGGLLHMASDGYWSVADKLGNYGIRGLPGRLCPSESNLWEYWDGSKAQPAEILVINI